MHGVLDFLSNLFMERDLKEDSEEEGCAVFNLKCSALEMKPGHPLLKLGTHIHNFHCRLLSC